MARCGEMMLKGLNRGFFERTLVDNIKSALSGLKIKRITSSRGRVFVFPKDSSEFDNAIKAVSHVFGIVSLSPVYSTEKSYESIRNTALEITVDIIDREGYSTFKVETRRADKSFPMKSPEINSRLGAEILDSVSGLSVDVHNPELTVFVEIRDKAYLYSEVIPGFGGLPVGTNGKAMLLLSGGIDSPVAGWMMAKRGLCIEAVHFFSYPYTSERSKDKVLKLAKSLSLYCGRIMLHIVPFTDIQLSIKEKCPDEEGTIIMRRFMMKIAQKISRKRGIDALITGESMGQVASQTLKSLLVTNSAVDIPVFRPLIGMDKNEVVEIARRIGTYETSILPFEDCCTLFVAKHPKTRPVLEDIMHSEDSLDMRRTISQAVDDTEMIEINTQWQNINRMGS